jgi:hypothetical protein
MKGQINFAVDTTRRLEKQYIYRQTRNMRVLMGSGAEIFDWECQICVYNKIEYF